MLVFVSVAVASIFISKIRVSVNCPCRNIDQVCAGAVFRAGNAYGPGEVIIASWDVAYAS